MCQGIVIRIPQKYTITTEFDIIRKLTISHGDVGAIYERDLSEITHIGFREVFRIEGQVTFITVVVHFFAVCGVVTPDVVVIKIST